MIDTPHAILIIIMKHWNPCHYYCHHHQHTIDIDECASSEKACGPHAACRNTPGSYECICPYSFKGDPYAGCEPEGKKQIFAKELHTKGEASGSLVIKWLLVSVTRMTRSWFRDKTPVTPDVKSRKETWMRVHFNQVDKKSNHSHLRSKIVLLIILVMSTFNFIFLALIWSVYF